MRQQPTVNSPLVNSNGKCDAVGIVAFRKTCKTNNNFSFHQLNLFSCSSPSKV